MQIILNKQEIYDLKYAVEMGIAAINSGGDEEERRWKGDKYNWQLMNDALRGLERVDEILNCKD